MFWTIFISALYFVAVSMAWSRGWIQAAFSALVNFFKAALSGPASGGEIPEGKPDYEKIRRLERELGVGLPDHECARGGRGCGVGCSAPALPFPEDDEGEEVRAWGQEAPVRRIDYRHRRRPDPKPQLPNPARPQIEKK